MDGERNLEREIESLLAVEPSSEFLARVRTRVAAEPAPGGWGLSWVVAGVCTVFVIGIVLFAWRSPEVTSPAAMAPPSHVPLESAQVAEAAPATAPVPAASVRPAPTRREVESGASIEADRAIEIDLPEVMLAENEVRAYTALVARIRERQFDAVVPLAPDPDRPLAIDETPPVEPLEIEPIVKVAGLQPEGEHP